ncbi:DNA recombination protein RmuC [Andreprevotia lacus DSM 23236]|jgi:DNA recombination protein RmuC|uniref:DNA recombination protein RmuC n=1 Tax=Andreprevotia lacus DSM 23236 TaxID=1121001 RepID=A0A1W1XWE9_9NEIS|nr:DNA recombination protein RmuC [Andreprevotia lacus]SMC28185.1 DNA recombination protein RmuC [Andreprevotia lacus DSM 23236]
MLESLFGITTLVVLLAGVLVAVRLQQLTRGQQAALELLGQELEARHREMLGNLHEGLSRQSEAQHAALAQHGSLLTDTVNRSSERMRDAVNESFDRLRDGVGRELNATREAMARLQTAQTESLSTLRLALTTALSESRESTTQQLGQISEALQSKQDQLREDVLLKLGQMLAEQSKREMEMIQTMLTNSAQQLTQSVGELTKTADGRLAEISGKVTERLDEGFKKTNETFASVMARLATIDEAQKKIDGLTSNVVSLQELLGDKRSRGAFGEVQLEHLVSNVLPNQVYELQSVLPNGTRVDCLLKLPEPTGTVAVDAKFPLENYHRMFEPGGDRTVATRAFKADIKKHIDDISSKYIIPNVTADGAVMFVPAEAVFAEIHAYHPDLVELAMSKRVWIVSPTTLMAVLNTARAVIKDVETRKQVHIIKEALGRLGQEFGRFDERMKKLAMHIRQAHDDAQQVSITSEKISRRFNEIEQVRLEGETVVPSALPSAD